MLPDFEAALEGVSAGQEKQFDVRFPENYQARDLAGKTAQFTIKVHKVEERRLQRI